MVNSVKFVFSEEDFTAGLGLPGPLQVDTGLILGGTKNPMCLSRLKEKVGST